MIKKIYFFMILGNFILNFVQAFPNPDQDPRIKKIYENFQDRLIWIHEGSWTFCGEQLLRTLSRVEEDGLWAEDYLPIVEALQRADLTSPEGQREADKHLTLAALNYITDMKGERLNPHLASKDIYVTQVSLDAVDLLKEYLFFPHPCTWLHGLAPSVPEYQHLKKLLSLYRQKKEQGGWPQLPKGTKLQKGDKGAFVETLRAQLTAQDIDFAQGQNVDVFDDEVEEALKRYQTLHGLEPDGKVGEATLLALNAPVEERIHSIIVSLERLRWFPSPLPARYIQVNVPGFYLKAVEKNVPLFYMPIITGREYQKTPIFNAMMTEIIFNPTWYVPTSIAAELMPKFESNPEAFERKGYYLTDSSHLVQRPGNFNSLGKIRFTLDSSFAIYLHGTPNEKLFQKAKRSLSHGCIRVADPYKLAGFVFHDSQKWPSDRIKEEASGTVTKHVKLETALPVFITYFTVFEDENCHMHFVEDEYGQDKDVWRALEKAKRNARQKTDSL